jgi:hypothetical protein
MIALGLSIDAEEPAAPAATTGITSEEDAPRLEEVGGSMEE